MGTARVAVIGGGLSGLATAAAMAERGCAVELFEARRKLGGRAGSYVDRETGEQIDHCQHVAMGCCTNFLDFCRRTGIEGLLERHERLYFFGPDGQRSDFGASHWLPAPLHLASSLFGLKYLSWNSKVGIARAMLRLVRKWPGSSASEPCVLEWLRGQNQSEEAIERFWKVVLVSALGESLDRASWSAARKVFLDGFLAHRDASHVLVPRVSLSELYDTRVAECLRKRGVHIHLETPVSSVAGSHEIIHGIRLSDGTLREFDFLIVAVPWQRVPEVLGSEMTAAVDTPGHFARIRSAPITSVHLWLDRRIMELPHAVLVGRLAQWVFARLDSAKAAGHYYQVVISASHDLAGRERAGVVEQVLSDLRAIFPVAAQARIVRWQMVTDRDAVFSVCPESDKLRPAQRTAIPNLFLAGDWTATGWPATMEGAVRSGYLAAEGVLQELGRGERIVVPDLPRGWLLRMILSE